MPSFDSTPIDKVVSSANTATTTYRIVEAMMLNVPNPAATNPGETVEVNITCENLPANGNYAVFIMTGATSVLPYVPSQQKTSTGFKVILQPISESVPVPEGSFDVLIRWEA